MSCSASSRSPRANSICASLTLASRRVGSSSSTRRSDTSSPAATSCSASEGTSPSKKRSTWAGGAAPTNWATSRPSLKALTAGIPWIWKAREIVGFSSVLTLTSSTFPGLASAARSRAGVSCRQGAHHGAQKSTTTGSSCERSRTAVWNSCSPMSTAMGQGYPRATHQRLSHHSTGPSGPVRARHDSGHPHHLVHRCKPEATRTGVSPRQRNEDVLGDAGSRTLVHAEIVPARSCLVIGPAVGSSSRALRPLGHVPRASAAAAHERQHGGDRDPYDQRNHRRGADVTEPLSHPRAGEIGREAVAHRPQRTGARVVDDEADRRHTVDSRHP